MKSRYRGKLDQNHKEICDTFRALGWSVAETTAQAGFVDAVIARAGVTIVVEIKRLEKNFSIGQLEFLASWPGMAAVVTSCDEAEALTRFARTRCIRNDDRTTLAKFCAGERARGATDKKEFSVEKILKLLGRI